MKSNTTSKNQSRPTLQNIQHLSSKSIPPCIQQQKVESKKSYDCGRPVPHPNFDMIPKPKVPQPQTKTTSMMFKPEKINHIPIKPFQLLSKSFDFSMGHSLGLSQRQSSFLSPEKPQLSRNLQGLTVQDIQLAEQNAELEKLSGKYKIEETDIVKKIDFSAEICDLELTDESFFEESQATHGSFW
ncbi:Hypothetical_protein [Hexamita inflata]|uniref:Hypothetical_protein n=1 Tax=Hexamita inflata TaxID=28002 RepID=A0AA86R050_9EUKA|nr:Hypothetical protein HINF_LOCUS56901 [Hexamita inflata]